MSDWREIAGEQNLRLAQKMLEQQGEVNELTAEVERLRGELATVTPEFERYYEHSVTLNAVAFRLAQALGDVPDGQEWAEGDPVELADRLIAERDRLRGMLAAVTAEAVDAVQVVADLTSVGERTCGRSQTEGWCPEHGYGMPPDVDPAAPPIEAVLHALGDVLAPDGPGQLQPDGTYEPVPVGAPLPRCPHCLQLAEAGHDERCQP